MTPELGITARAVVNRIVDGDTLDLELRIPIRVRLMDCWAQERDSPEGLQAMMHLQRMAPDRSSVIVHIPTQRAHNLKDVFTFGRVLGRVWREGDDESLSEAMVASGYATREKQ